ncbi:uncharacterized protein LOC130138085 isoform X2 [Syzygium oleosum]|uniref:uncharacterized protein LOC130138085 isoform X2 n=1 Tax=Syzygium oleosum TaxID=219896 RepID=UPI0024BB9653|nr:uncharacterized protein LOC130138085 isoform X2 [Syzygium oleosum]
MMTQRNQHMGYVKKLDYIVTDSCWISRISSAGIPDDLQQELLDLSDLKEGDLPLKNSAVPLVLGELSVVDCKPLLDKLSSKFNAWTASKLFHVAGLQLISTVIQSIVNHWVAWMKTYKFKKQILLDSENSCRCFLYQHGLFLVFQIRVIW